MSPAQSLREPSRERLGNPFLSYPLPTRPVLLSITLAGCLLGFATADADGAAFGWVYALAMLLLSGDFL